MKKYFLFAIVPMLIFMLAPRDEKHTTREHLQAEREAAFERGLKSDSIPPGAIELEPNNL